MQHIRKTVADELSDPYVRLQVAAEYTNQSLSSIRNAAKRGRLKVVRLSPRCVRTRMSWLREYAEASA